MNLGLIITSALDEVMASCIACPFACSTILNGLRELNTPEIIAGEDELRAIVLPSALYLVPGHLNIKKSAVSDPVPDILSPTVIVASSSDLTVTSISPVN